MIAIDIKKVKAVQKRFDKEIEQQRIFALEELQKIDVIDYTDIEKDYLADVINLFATKNLLVKKPFEIEQQIIDIKIAPIDRIPNISIRKDIQKALNYKGLRNSFFPEYFYNIGIKACVYCNSNLTISTCKRRPRSPEYKAKFDVDHYYSKDKYPFLSISLFNLYPTCASCNRAKKDNKVFFELYSDDLIKTTKSEFEFVFDVGSEAKYLNSNDYNDLKFKFQEPLVPDNTYKTFQDVFRIQELYETQKDIVEELVAKNKMYNQSNRKQLRDSFDKLNLSDELFDRIILGNYKDPVDIHKRPIAKFAQDIAYKLGLIKRYD